MKQTREINNVYHISRIKKAKDFQDKNYQFLEFLSLNPSESAIKYIIKHSFSSPTIDHITSLLYALLLPKQVNSNVTIAENIIQRAQIILVNKYIPKIQSELSSDSNEPILVILRKLIEHIKRKQIEYYEKNLPLLDGPVRNLEHLVNLAIEKYSMQQSQIENLHIQSIDALISRFPTYLQLKTRRSFTDIQYAIRAAGVAKLKKTLEELAKLYLSDMNINVETNEIIELFKSILKMLEEQKNPSSPTNENDIQSIFKILFDCLDSHNGLLVNSVPAIKAIFTDEDVPEKYLNIFNHLCKKRDIVVTENEEELGEEDDDLDDDLDDDSEENATLNFFSLFKKPAFLLSLGSFGIGILMVLGGAAALFLLPFPLNMAVGFGLIGAGISAMGLGYGISIKGGINLFKTAISFQNQLRKVSEECDELTEKNTKLQKEVESLKKHSKDVKEMKQKDKEEEEEEEDLLEGQRKLPIGISSTQEGGTKSTGDETQTPNSDKPSAT